MTRPFTAEDIEKRNARNKAAWDSQLKIIKQSKVAEKPANKPNKFRNVKTEVDGIQFHSKKEAKRWQELKLLEASREIQGLTRQVKYTLIRSQERADGTKERPVIYVADFEYWTAKNSIVVEDSKGVRTPDYVIKRKLMLFVHGITILET